MLLLHPMHLSLPVRDAVRSQRFDTTYFGFDPATAQQYYDGTIIIRNGDGFDLALHAGRTPARCSRSYSSGSGSPAARMFTAELGVHLDSLI